MGYDSQNISLFLLNIIECIKYVDKKLSRGTKFKGNKEDEIKLFNEIINININKKVKKNLYIFFIKPTHYSIKIISNISTLIH